jgi:SAM-dependent methyltransferase
VTQTLAYSTFAAGAAEHPPATSAPHVPYVCPGCNGELTRASGRLACRGCGAAFELTGSAYADFAPGVAFDDWWDQTAELRRQWLAEKAPREEEFQIGHTRNYLLPLLRRLGHQPGRASVLSAACGLGADVELLNGAGYDAWGIDCGSRVIRWAERRCRVRLSRADLFALPFPDASFDMVQCLNVLEHIGTLGDTTQVTPDYQEQRLAAMRSLLRVVKPGGHLLLSGVSRHFPLDFFHLQESHGVRAHSPWEPFSLACQDYARLAEATGLAESTEPLKLRGFFSWTHLRHRPLTRPLLPVVDWALGALPAGFYGSALSFFTVVLVRRGPADAAHSRK